MPAPTLAKTVESLRQLVASARARQARIGLVPTMGALHAGHVALVERARHEADFTVASIFVNPTQFAPAEDLSRYPRTLEEDLAKLETAGADAAFVPDAEIMYPPGFSTRIALTGPAVAGLEDRIRPDHFPGVATIVAKLFIQSGADVAVFGEKDYQQLCVVRQLARDLDLPIVVVGEPTVREPDGLALSSRNRYLKPEERAAAPVLHRVLTAAKRSLDRGGDAGTILAEGRETIARAGFDLDYLELRQDRTLAPVTDTTKSRLRLLVAARIGTTRLIDNVGVGASNEW
jgi:pantoate--beta-alanine ligase